MPEPTLPARLLDAAVDAMPYDPDDGCLPVLDEHGDIDRWVPVEHVARDTVVAVLRALAADSPSRLELVTTVAASLHELADEIEAIAANPTITDTHGHDVAHHRHEEGS